MVHTSIACVFGSQILTLRSGFKLGTLTKSILGHYRAITGPQRPRQGTSLLVPLTASCFLLLCHSLSISFNYFCRTYSQFTKHFTLCILSFWGPEAYSLIPVLPTRQMKLRMAKCLVQGSTHPVRCALFSGACPLNTTVA